MIGLDGNEYVEEPTLEHMIANAILTHWASGSYRTGYEVDHDKSKAFVDKYAHVIDEGSMQLMDHTEKLYDVTRPDFADRTFEDM
jgi:hypothetical protein